MLLWHINAHELRKRYTLIFVSKTLYVYKRVKKTSRIPQVYVLFFYVLVHFYEEQNIALLVYPFAFPALPKIAFLSLLLRCMAWFTPYFSVEVKIMKNYAINQMGLDTQPSIIRQSSYRPANSTVICMKC